MSIGKKKVDQSETGPHLQKLKYFYILCPAIPTHLNPALSIMLIHTISTSFNVILIYTLVAQVSSVDIVVSFVTDSIHFQTPQGWNIIYYK